MHTVGIHHDCHDIWCRVSYKKAFSANMENYWTLSIKYFATVSQQMLTATKHVAGDILSSVKTVHWRFTRAVQSNCGSTNSYLCFCQLWLPLNSPAVNPAVEFLESHIITSMNRQSTGWKKSSSDWLNLVK